MDGGTHQGHYVEGKGVQGQEDIQGHYQGGVTMGIEQSQGKVATSQKQVVGDGRLGTLIATRTGKWKLGGIVKAVISGRANKMSNYICVLQVSKDATQALHFPAKLGIG
jgi:hypothetical protein